MIIMDDRIFKRRCFYVAATIIGLFLIIAMLWNVSVILGVCVAVFRKVMYYISPLIYAFVIAYILYIPVSYMEAAFKKNKRIAEVRPGRLRAATIVITYVAVVALVVLIVASIYLMIGGQLSRNTDINYIVNYIINYVSGFKVGDISVADNPTLKEALTAVEEWAQKYLSSSLSLSSLTSKIGEIGTSLVIGIISFIISIYFLMDYEKLTERMSDAYLAATGRTRTGRKLYKAINVFSSTFKQFLRGQLLEACIVAVMSVVALWIARVNYCGIIGVIAGICNLIPYVGPWIGAIVAALVSLLGGGYMTALWAIIAMIVVQQIDNHLLAPKIVGDSVGLHPVIIMVALIVGADVGGIFGMLLAVPVFATVKNLIVLSREGHGKLQAEPAAAGSGENDEEDENS